MMEILMKRKEEASHVMVSAGVLTFLKGCSFPVLHTLSLPVFFYFLAGSVWRASAGIAAAIAHYLLLDRRFISMHNFLFVFFTPPLFFIFIHFLLAGTSAWPDTDAAAAMHACACLFDSLSLSLVPMAG